MLRRSCLSLLVTLSVCTPDLVDAQDQRLLHSFDVVPLTDVYYSEGANFGDLDADGNMDIVHGPYWWKGPEFASKFEIYPPKAQPRERYADNFFSWVYDFNADGGNDVFVVGFPGTPAYVYENPGTGGFSSHWKKHQVFDWVSNESPHFTNIVGDERPELVCTRDGFFGYATIDWDQPFAAWKFHIVSKQTASKRFGHGLGVGDVNGDGRADILHKDGWFEQPASTDGDPEWKLHAYPFARPGGAEMYAYDVDGDGDNDVITSLNAHNFGLAWHEQQRTDAGEIRFRQHLIMGDKPADNKYGLVFSEPHSVNLADIDGDGLKDIVTGKTYWSHHTQSPMWDAGAVVYWFKLSRSDAGIDWIPFKAASDTGIGRQVIVGDLNNDSLPDLVVGGMKGAHALLHKTTAVDQATYQQAQPRPFKPTAAGLTPEEAAANMTVPAGFRVQLAAGEPLVHQPIGFTIDQRGRLWVAEAYTYPIRAPEGQGRDKIIILEDTDGDGTLDDRKVFAEGLNLVSGLEVGFGGVWVGAAPYLLFIPDADGDDQPDSEPQVLLDGFGFQDTHETLNGFIWGPDGWLYGCHGVFTHSRVGKPGTPQADRTPINAGIWRYHPTQHKFEVFAHGTSNPWGVDFNNHGQAFATACVIPHLFHIVQGGRYQRQAGRHFNAYTFDDIKTIADHAHYAGNIRDHAWWGSEPDLPSDTSAAGGGHAHCGAMIYLGDQWPAQYRDTIFMHNIHGNRVNNDILKRQGSGFVGHHGNDLLLANDKWFRGINLKYGPDGAVYLIDWYDKNACHRRTPEIWDRTNGRIYRLSYQGSSTLDATDKVAADPRLDLARRSAAELVALQQHPNEWLVRTSRRLLTERFAGLPEASRLKLQNELKAQLANTESAAGQLRAIWALHSIGEFDERLAARLLDSPQEYVRAWTVQLQLEDRSISTDLHKRLVRLARTDTSAVVRLYLASALQRLTLQQRWPIAEGLAGRTEDAGDPNIPLLLWYGIEPLVPLDPPRAMRLARRSKIPLLERFVIRRAAADNRLIKFAVAALGDSATSERQLLVLDEMLAAFTGRANMPMPAAWTDTYQQLLASESAEVRDRADRVAVALGDQRIFPRMRKVLVDSQAPLENRQRALEILVSGRDNQAAPSLHKALDEKPLRRAAIRALASIDDSNTSKLLIERYPQLNDDERRDAVSTLVARPAFAMSLLDAIDDDRIPRTDLHAYHIRQLRGFEDADLNRRIREAWGEVRDTAADKKARIQQLKTLLRPAALRAADTSHGRQIFAKTCASCHVLFGEGGKVGPDITGSNRGNLDYVLENTVDPSAVLGKAYRMTVLITTDGRVISGLIQQETESALTIRTINESIVVAKDDIDQRRPSPLSLMPDNLLDPLNDQQILALVAYLQSPRQVALRGPRAPIDPQTGLVPEAIEGEAMKIVSVSRGTARSQKMGNFQGDRWSGTDQLFWTGGRRESKLVLELPVKQRGPQTLELVLTRARDYGIIQLWLNDRKLGDPIDLYNAEVVTTGVLSFENIRLPTGPNRLTIQILGTNPQAKRSFMVGLDYVRLVPQP